MIHEMDQWLRQRMSGLRSEELELEKVLSDLTSRWRMPDVFRAIAADEHVLAAISKRSYRHLNGFDRIELLSSINPEYGLRLHIWWGDCEHGKERVHGHPWNFASVILTGALRIEQFVEAETGNQVEFCNYERPDGRDAYTLTPSGTATLRLIVRSALAANSHYYADHRIIHRVWADPGLPSASLMLHGKATAYPSRVFLLSGRKELATENHRRLSFDAGALRSALERVGELLQK
jgi:hypothetical protein